MSEDLRDRNDPELKCLSVERSNFNDPATQAEWTQKRLVWVPSDTQVSIHARCLGEILGWLVFFFLAAVVVFVQKFMHIVIFQHYTPHHSHRHTHVY
jgi:hypothetical protein